MPSLRLRELPILLASENPLNLRAPSFVDVSRSRDSAVVSDMRDKSVLLSPFSDGVGVLCPGE